MSDLISRQATIDAIVAHANTIYQNVKHGATIPKREWFDGMSYACEIIKTIPSAEAIPVSWIKERIENAINAKQTLIAQMWLELIDGYRREMNEKQ